MKTLKEAWYAARLLLGMVPYSEQIFHMSPKQAKQISEVINDPDMPSRKLPPR